MRIKTNRTASLWADIESGDEEAEAAEIGGVELARHLSQAIRSANLVVLAGLGTSLCVKRGDTTLAPTMGRLRELVRAKFDELDAADRPPGERSRWARFTSNANVPEDEDNLERLLSRAKLAAELADGAAQRIQEELLAAAEGVIRDAVDFLGPDVALDTHADFIRRIARRPARKSRVRIFTTNYDRCFEVAAGREEFIVVDGFAFGP